MNLYNNILTLSVQQYIEVKNVGKILNISLWKHFIQEPCFSSTNKKLVGVKYTETGERFYQDLELLMSSKTVLNQEKIL